MAGPAPIYSLATDARAEAAAWARFSSARDAAEFCASWLAILCAQVDRASGALLLLGPEPDGAYRAAAVWPDPARNMQYLSPAAEKALKERRGIVVARDGVSAPTREQPALIGYPIEVSGVLRGAVALDLAPGPEQALQQALRRVYWASAWLVDQFRQQDLKELDTRLARLALATRLKCDRVSLGFEESGSVEVQAISHTASFDRKTSLVRLIGEAMDEVLDLDASIVYPARDGDELGAIAHGELAREFKDLAICSVPLAQDGHAGGVLTLERSRGEAFDAEAIELCKTVGMLLGPILALKRENERGEWQRLREALAAGARALFGPRHPGVKLLALIAGAVVLFCSLAAGEYRV